MRVCCASVMPIKNAWWLSVRSEFRHSWSNIYVCLVSSIRVVDVWQRRQRQLACCVSGVASRERSAHWRVIQRIAVIAVAERIHAQEAHASERIYERGFMPVMLGGAWGACRVRTNKASVQWSQVDQGRGRASSPTLPASESARHPQGSAERE